MGLSRLFPHMPKEHETEATQIYKAIFGDLPVNAWSLKGTILTRYVNGKKINFAARRTHCTIGFQGHAVIEFYRFIGGVCPAGEVTIKIPYYKPIDPEPLKEAVSWYFNN